MKLSIVSATAILSIAFAGATFAADSADSSSASGTSDSTVMTQTHDAKAVKKQQKTIKGGRPVNSKTSTTQ